MKPTDIYLFSGTHWDREWYQNFQGFRSRLVEMVDDLIDYLEKADDYETFHFDGQTIVLEDYKEIAPENEERLKKLIKDGKIKIGPWYVMPDEYLLSGESLIRNLLKGTRLSKKWGAEPWLFGYICDIFGHIAQLPQIFTGFGINETILGRGLTEKDPAFIIWQAPDGSENLTFNLAPRDGYGEFTSTVANRITENTSDEEIKELIKKHVDSEIARSNTNIVILMDALDHIGVNKNTPKFIKIIKELYPDINVHHCDLRESEKLLNEVRDTLEIRKGELNKTAMERNGYLHLITNTLSSHYPIKKQNDECQILLEKELEPITAYLKFAGKGIRRSYIDLAYQYLIQNHPHDSICGCSVYQVHKDMIYRFDQVKEIGEDIKDRFLFEGRKEETNPKAYVLRLYNTLPFERNECITTEVILDNAFPTRYSEPFGYESMPSFKLIATDGKEVPYKVLSSKKNYGRRVTTNKKDNGEGVNISFMAKIPPMGYTEFKIVPYAMPSRYLKTMTSGVDFAENEFIKVSFNSDGEITIFDKKTEKTYENLCSFASDGEIGDGWYHANAVEDKVVYSKGTGALIEKIENGPSKVTFRIIKDLLIPEKMDTILTGRKRSDNYVKVPVTMEVGLSENARFADVKMTIDNRARDHRLKLMLPTGIYEDSYFSGQAYYLNERKTAIDYSTQDYREHDQYEKQTNGIFGKREREGRGIAFVSPYGLHECSAYEGDLLSVTLLRAFEKTRGTIGEDQCQIIGKHDYRFALCPLDSSVSYSELLKIQDCLGVTPMTTYCKVGEGYELSEDSFMELVGENLALSIVKNPEEAEDSALIIRVYNASAENSKGRINLKLPVKKLIETNLNEEELNELPFDDKGFEIKLSPWKIATYKVIM